MGFGGLMAAMRAKGRRGGLGDRQEQYDAYVKKHGSDIPATPLSERVSYGGGLMARLMGSDSFKEKMQAKQAGGLGQLLMPQQQAAPADPYGLAYDASIYGVPGPLQMQPQHTPLSYTPSQMAIMEQPAAMQFEPQYYNPYQQSYGAADYRSPLDIYAETGENPYI